MDIAAVCHESLATRDLHEWTNHAPARTARYPGVLTRSNLDPTESGDVTDGGFVAVDLLPRIRADNGAK